VALNGDGGDEDFAGYQRYWLDPFANSLLHSPAFVTKKLIPAVAGMFPDSSNKPVGQSVLNGLKRLAQLPEFDRRASILRWGSFFSPTHRAGLWKGEYWQGFKPTNAQDYLIQAYESMKGTMLDRTLYMDLHTYLPGDLLVKADRMTMAASLEGRSPFLDQELVAWSARLPDQFKVRGRSGKYLLKKAFAKELPAELKSRGKQGFGIPVGAWFRGPLFSWARELMESRPMQTYFQRDAMLKLINEHHSGKEDHGKRLYALSMLALWLK
jgi:asparagine synthase (glutamine-hydrolysing)